MSFFDTAFHAAGASLTEIDRLQELVGAPLSSEVRGYFEAVGSRPHVLDPILEWSVSHVWHDLIPIAHIIEVYESGDEGWLRAARDSATSLLMLGYAGHGSPAVMVVDPSEENAPVWLADVETGQGIDGTLVAGSFRGFVKGLVLPGALAGLARETESADIEVSVRDAAQHLAEVRTRFDEVLDSLVEITPPSRGTYSMGGLDFRDHLMGAWKTSAQPLTSAQDRVIAIPARSLPRRFAVLVRLIVIMIVLERQGGTMVDRLGLFDDDITQALTAADLAERLAALRGPGDIDDLTLRFRAQVAAPAATRITARERRQLGG